MNTLITFALLCWVLASSLAYSAPPQKTVPLSPQEKKGLQLGTQWKTANVMPARGPDGSVTFTYGAALPSLVCAPLYVCDVRLQPGETIIRVDVGDAVRWKVSPVMSGTGEATLTHIVVKPTEPGLSTNMLVTTDRRTYMLKLVSHHKDWMPIVNFSYPDSEQEGWNTYKTEQQRRLREESKAQDVAHLDFGYRVQGRQTSWRPERVYTDGTKTYIQFPLAIKNSETPALLALSAKGEEQLVNYRMAGTTYVVDKVLDRAVLVQGTGSNQQRILIRKVAR